MNKTFEQETQGGDRFEFGANWNRFLKILNDDRIAEAVKSLRSMIGVENLHGKTFIDVGSGSGLFSLAAMKMGATSVHSFDFDPNSVACTQELKKRYFPNASNWKIECGSVLEPTYLASLGKFNFVYSWGVLHHTGRMWDALENVTTLIAPNGFLFVAIYNDQGYLSERWLKVKKRYNKSLIWRWLITGWYCSRFALEALKMDLVRLRSPMTFYRNYTKSRGMSAWHDWIDWLGGYPFEVATPEAIFEFYQKKGYTLKKLVTRQGLGCNEFVFQRKD